MFCTHIYFNGNCEEAIEVYQKAFSAKVLSVIQNPEPGKNHLIIHSELEIHHQKLIMNDFGDNEGITTPGGYQLVVQFENKTQLDNAYSELEDASKILFPKQATDYSPCVTRFIDKFGTRWAFMI